MRSLLLLLGFLPVLSSCIMGTMLVTKLDTLIELRMSHSMQLYVAQDRVLEKDVAAYLNAHHSMGVTMLALARTVDPGHLELVPQQVQQFLEIYRSLMKDFTRDVLVKTVLTLDKSQRKVFFKNLQEQNEELREKLKVGRTEEYHDRMEYFVGDLTDAQLRALKPHEKVFQEQDQKRLERRVTFHTELKALLDLKTPDRSQKVLDAFAANQAASLSDTAYITTFVVDLCKSLNKDQKKHLLERRDGFIEMLEKYNHTTYE